MEYRESIDEREDAFRALLDDQRATIWTAMPGIVQSFDPDACTASVQPAFQAEQRDYEGGRTLLDLPLCDDVPVVFPGGGGATLTFPVKAGDECLLVFASRNIDAWWQSGASSRPVDTRKHDLSDAFALVGVRSQPRRLGAVSTAETQLRSDDGGTLVALNPGGAVRIVAPGGLSVVGDVTVTGSITSTGDQRAGSISQQTHRHGGVQPGSGSSGAPLP